MKENYFLKVFFAISIWAFSATLSDFNAVYSMLKWQYATSVGILSCFHHKYTSMWIELGTTKEV